MNTLPRANLPRMNQDSAERFEECLSAVQQQQQHATRSVSSLSISEQEAKMAGASTDSPNLSPNDDNASVKRVVIDPKLSL